MKTGADLYGLTPVISLQSDPISFSYLMRDGPGAGLAIG